MQDHPPRLDASQPGDEGQEHVPEREGVPGMEAAVPELVERPQVQVGEGEQLPHASEVEERVAVQRPRHVPEQDPEARRRARPRATGRRRGTDSRLRGTATSSAAPSGCVQPEREVERPPTANMIAPAPESPARLQAAVADTLGRLSARAISAPGSSTVSVAAASFR